MAKSKTVAKNGTKKSKALFVFDIIFIILVLLAVVSAVLLFTPLQNSLPSPGENLMSTLYTWVYYHVLKPFDRGIRQNLNGYPSKPFTVAFFLWLIYLAGVLFLYRLYQPFVIRANNKAKGKTQVYRKVFSWLTFVVILICGLALFSQLYRNRREKIFGSAYSWFNQLVDKVAGSFKSGKLFGLKLSLISKNPYFNAFAYATFACIFFEIVRLRIAGCGKPAKVTEPKKELASEPSKEEQSIKDIPEAEENSDTESVPYIPPKTITAEQAQEKASTERVEPTYHDVNLLNRLECIHSEPIKDLPGLNENDLQKVRLELGPDGIYPIVDTAGKVLLEKLDTVSIEVRVLPGIDEWNADPWAVEPREAPVEEKEVDSSRFEIIKPVEQDIVIEEPKEEPVEQVEETKPEEVIEEKPVEEKPVEEPIQEEHKKDELTDLTASAAPIPRNEAPITDAKPAEPVEEEAKEEEPEGPITLAINDDLNDGKHPQEENHDKVEEENKESRSERKETIPYNSHKEIVTDPVTFDSEWRLPKYVAPKVTGPVTTCINQLPKDGKRPQEEDHAKVEQAIGLNRIDKKEVIKDNSHLPITTQTTQIDNTWILPRYVAPKPRGTVKKVDLAPINKPNGMPKPSTRKPITPIKPIAPIVEPAPIEPVEVKKEEPKIVAPLAGPLHSTEKSKHQKIEAVKARRVPFVLQNYQLKTYKGDLTAEQAFARGVTKVQPTARPIFANQGNESSWKQKRREEEIRKNGYADVTKVEKLSGKVEPSTVQAAPSGSSIRELRASLKAEKAKAEEVKTEEKQTPIKPIAPIKPITPIKPVNAEEKPAEEKKVEPSHPTTASFFHPLAPIAKKPRKRPEIKPVDPLSKKK